MTNPSVPKLDRSALLGILAQQSDDVLAKLMGTVAQAAIDAQFDEFIGAERYERSDDRNPKTGRWVTLSNLATALRNA